MGVERSTEYEQRFRRAGLPLFIADRSAATDVFNRAVPLLGLVFLIEMLGALNLEWPPLANIAAVAGGLAVLLAAIALSNKARGRPAVAIPQDVGRIELALFVTVPALCRWCSTASGGARWSRRWQTSCSWHSCTA